MSAADTQASDETVRRVSSLWKDAAIELPPDDESAAEKALLFRINLRVDILKALQASWETAKAAFRATAALHNPLDPIGWVEAGVDTISAVQTILAALVESMPKIDFVTAVILANHDGGMQPNQLKAAVEKHLRGEDATKYAWYLGMSDKYVRAAAATLQTPTWFETAIQNLDIKGFIKRDTDKLVFQSKNCTIGWASE
jgi:hypothetical protein